MNPITTLRRGGLLLAAMCLVSTLPGQIGERSRSLYRTLGSSDLNVAHWAWARARGTDHSRIDTVTDTRFTLFGNTYSLHRLAVTGVRTASWYSGSYTFTMGGMTTDVGNVAPNTRKVLSRVTQLWPIDPFFAIDVGVFRVRISFNWALASHMDLNFLDFARSVGVGISGATNTHAGGWSDFDLSILGGGMSGGTHSELWLGGQKFDGYLAAFPNYLSTQYLNYTFTAARLKLDVVVTAFWGLARYVRNVVDASYGVSNYSPFIQ